MQVPRRGGTAGQNVNQFPSFIFLLWQMNTGEQRGSEGGPAEPTAAGLALRFCSPKGAHLPGALSVTSPSLADL